MSRPLLWGSLFVAIMGQVGCGGRVRDGDDRAASEGKIAVGTQAAEDPGGGGVQCPREIPEHGSRCEIPDGHRCPYALCRSGERIAHCDSGTWVVSDEGSCATLPEARCPFEAPLVGAVCEEGTPTCAYACDGGIEHFRCEAGRFVEEQACAPHGP